MRSFDSSLVWALYILCSLVVVAFALSYKIRLFSRGATQVVEELNKALAFNNLLISLKNHPDAGRFACGVGPISLMGKDDS